MKSGSRVGTSHGTRLITIGGLVLALVVGACADRPQTAGPPPLAAALDDGAWVGLELTCVTRPSAGHFMARFSYENSGADAVEIPVGEANTCNDAGLSCGQPTSFEPGVHTVDIAVTGASLTWTLLGQPVTADTNSDACPESTPTEWPNELSRANSDPWLVAHHAEIQRVRPQLLVLNFANPSTPSGVSALLDKIVAGFAEGSKPQGFKTPAAQPQLSYQLAKPVIDLRDGVEGRPPAPAGFAYDNSTLYPRRPASEAGYYRLDYATFFEPDFAVHYGYEDPAQPGRYLTLCELVERGLINELWLVASDDKASDVSHSEVLEAKPRYGSDGQPIPGAVERCAGNGCFDADVPFCGRSLRIGWVNYNRGPGCYLHSHGHGMEWTSNSAALPGFTRWFAPFANMDLDARWGLPFKYFYAVDCATKPCISYPQSDVLSVTYAGATNTRTGYDANCGNVHFPPNGVDHYDYNATRLVASSCESFGRANPETKLINASTWSQFTAFGDCGGEFLIWWYQNMPSYGTGQSFADGAPMLAAWPYLFY